MREIRLEGRGRVRKGKGQKHTLQPTELIYRMCRGWGSILNPTISAISSLIPLSRMWWFSLPRLWKWSYQLINSVQSLSQVRFFVTHGLQHARPPCPSWIPWAYSNSCPLSQWCHPTISSSVISFYSHLQSFRASGFFPKNQFFTSDGQSIGVSALASVFPMNIQDWFPLGFTGWISLLSKGLSRVFSNTTVQKHQFFDAQPSSQSNSHIHTWPQEKP